MKVKKIIKHCYKTLFSKIKGDIFSNPGSITEDDFKEIKLGIEKIKPEVFLEIGTGKGISTKKIFKFLNANYPKCDFYTIEVYKRYYQKIRECFDKYETFHPFLGLSVKKEEAGYPASKELRTYKGPDDIVRKIIRDILCEKAIDIVFIDSRKGTALPEFLILERYMSKNGIIFCHDVLNKGKGVEVELYLRSNSERYTYKVLNTGPTGILKIEFS